MKEESWFKEFHDKSFYIAFRRDKLLKKIKSEYQEIEVFENEFWGKVLIIDGLVMLTEKDELFYHEAIAHPPLFVHRKPENILIIGGGDGGTLREVLKHNVKRVDLVEIDREVINVAKEFFPSSANSFSDKRANIITEDGINFLKETKNIYDVIIVDSSEPFGPSSVLFTEEFYSLMRDKTSEHGVISSQLGSYLFHKSFIREFFPKIKNLFKSSSLYKGITPTYPGGIWVYGIFSKENSVKNAKWNNKLPLSYYNELIYKGSLFEEEI